MLFIDGLIADKSTSPAERKCYEMAKNYRAGKSVEDRMKAADLTHKHSGLGVHGVALLELLLIGNDAPLRYQIENVEGAAA